MARVSTAPPCAAATSLDTAESRLSAQPTAAAAAAAASRLLAARTSGRRCSSGISALARCSSEARRVLEASQDAIPCSHPTGIVRDAPCHIILTTSCQEVGNPDWSVTGPKWEWAWSITAEGAREGSMTCASRGRRALHRESTRTCTREYTTPTLPKAPSDSASSAASTSKQSVNYALRASRLTFHYVRCKQTRLANRNL